MNNDSISRDALKETIDQITWYHFNAHGELTDGAHDDDDAFYKAEDIYKAIDNAPSVEPFERIGSVCEENCGYRPQGEWKVDDKIYCSECGAILCDFVPNPTDAIVIILENKFCFNCGADMRKGGAEE